MKGIVNLVLTAAAWGIAGGAAVLMMPGADLTSPAVWAAAGIAALASAVQHLAPNPINHSSTGTRT